MKLFKQISSLILALAMSFAVSTTAFAADTTDIKNNTEISALNTIDQTFYMISEHTGATRQYNASSISYTAVITDANGNPVNNIISIKLYQSNGQLIHEDQMWANGNPFSASIPITYGNSYYFKYALAYGTPTSLKVHMRIT